MSEHELEDDNELGESTLNIDDTESSEQLKSRKTITNTSRSIDELDNPHVPPHFRGLHFQMFSLFLNCILP